MREVKAATDITLPLHKFNNNRLLAERCGKQYDETMASVEIVGAWRVRAKIFLPS